MASGKGFRFRSRRELRILRLQGFLLRYGVVGGRRGVYEGKLPVIDRRGTGSLVIGARPWFRGQEARPLLRVDEGGSLEIGLGALINSGASIHVAQSVVIGDRFLMGPFASIMDTNSHEVQSGEGVRVLPVRIGDDVWLGRNAMIMPGVTIENGAVIAAGSIVTSDVEQWTVVAGVPAKRVRAIHQGERK